MSFVIAFYLEINVIDPHTLTNILHEEKASSCLYTSAETLINKNPQIVTLKIMR
jgi:hypothetical protein